MPDGTYDFLKMPFGMKNAGTTLARGMRRILARMNNVDSYRVSTPSVDCLFFEKLTNKIKYYKML